MREVKWERGRRGREGESERERERERVREVKWERGRRGREGESVADIKRLFRREKCSERFQIKNMIEKNMIIREIRNVLINFLSRVTLTYIGEGRITSKIEQNL